MTLNTDSYYEPQVTNGAIQLLQLHVLCKYANWQEGNPIVPQISECGVRHSHNLCGKLAVQKRQGYQVVE